jgi:hypothetical protein
MQSAIEAERCELPSSPQQRCDMFIQSMKTAAPFGQTVNWESNVWDVTDASTRAPKRTHERKRDRLLFGEYENESRGAGFERFFADFSKAIVCYRHNRLAHTPPAHRVAIRALRYICRSLRTSRTTSISAIRLYHLIEAENSAAEALEPSTAYRIGQQLQHIAAILDRKQLVDIRLGFVCSLRRPLERAKAEKQIDDEIIDIVGDISASIGREQGSAISDIILMRVVDILVCTGFRIGEALTLPEDPIEVDDEGTALRYWAEKDGEKKLKRIRSAAAELAKRAVSELQVICAPARQMARWLYDNPGRVFFPPGTPKYLSSYSITEMLRITHNGARAMSSNAPRHLVGGESVIDRDDVERILVGRRDDRLVISGSHYRQYLHESLLVTFLNEMHRTRATIRLLVSPLKSQRIWQFLGGRDDVEDVFGRIADGQTRKLTSHQFRHWLDTLCKRGGLNDLEVARFFGRKRLRDNRAYDHRTTEERAEEVRQLIREDKVAGAIVDAYEACPIESREEFLRNQVTASLLMPNGGCIHDWGQSPCALHMNREAFARRCGVLINITVEQGL